MGSQILVNVKGMLAAREVADDTMPTTLQIETIRFAEHQNHTPRPNTVGMPDEV